ncbi:hypothetical protein GA0061070_101645 [Kosakonia oryziphila]|uniref:Short chain dehydrogenase n=1 Tax=Kosakonia oryziphila TaxID=1005667 RepID=A0A1C4DH56_9ENTR|nr:hypothetical protein GA0061070_101645 [Kosakonia oryziphila]
MSAKKIVFITGVSSGFGRALAQEALAAGYRVIGTVRNTRLRRCHLAALTGVSWMSRISQQSTMLLPKRKPASGPLMCW